MRTVLKQKMGLVNFSSVFVINPDRKVFAMMKNVQANGPSPFISDNFTVVPVVLILIYFPIIMLNLKKNCQI